MTAAPETRILAIVGGGPAALMLYKTLLDSGAAKFSIHIFEATDRLGQGMPYSVDGAGREHVTNVSADELPEMATSLGEWLHRLPADRHAPFAAEIDGFHDKKVLPRLLFGQYLQGQFEIMIVQASERGVVTEVHYHSRVVDIVETPGHPILLKIDGADDFAADAAVICTGHNWPRGQEDRVEGYYDSPYPPAKLERRFDHDVAVRGSSLTAVDAIRTMARANGSFVERDGRLTYRPATPGFRIVMYSRNGLLPCIRVHMEDPHVAGETAIPQAEIEQAMRDNDGFLPLDFMFERGFKQPLRDSDPAFHARIRDMTLEEFFDAMMRYRHDVPPFELFGLEYAEAARSIERERPVYWKEQLSALSFALNYPAKHLSAEDMLRLQKTMSPLISIVIAFAPQDSCDELIALHGAGRLEIVAVGAHGEVEVDADGSIVVAYDDETHAPVRTPFRTFVDSIGQPHMGLKEFPFRSLVNDNRVSGATLPFRDPDAGGKLLAGQHPHVIARDGASVLEVSGLAITDAFQAIDGDGTASDRLYIMAVPYIGGYNPDYSGLDFCEHASGLLVPHLIR